MHIDNASSSSNNNTSNSNSNTSPNPRHALLAAVERGSPAAENGARSRDTHCMMMCNDLHTWHVHWNRADTRARHGHASGNIGVPSLVCS